MNQTEKPNENQRRDFLSRLFMGGGLLASGALLLRHGLAFVFPRSEPPAFRRLLVGRTDELEPGQAKEFEIGGQPMFLVHTEEGYQVFSGVCTHLGCRVKWEAYRDRFYCPCHKGEFARDGTVVSGPPPRPLDGYRVETEGSLVYMWVEDKRERGFA